MNHHDAEISDVVVVLDGQGAKQMDAAVKSLKDLGMEISSVNSNEAVIEGSVPADKVPQLKAVAGVCYVRSVFTYTADYPCGDPRDKDGVEGPCETDED
jgi:hypothetical protein